MALDLWRPRSMMRPFRDMEDMVNRLFADWPRLREEHGGWNPSVDMIDRQDEVVLRADLPGMEQKDIDVTVQDNMITIRGERKEEREEKDKDYYCCERTFGTFTRTMALPPSVDPEGVKATFKNGILEVRLPKTREAKGRKVEIKAA